MDPNILEMDSKIRTRLGTPTPEPNVCLLPLADFTAWFIGKIQHVAAHPPDSYNFYLIETIHLLRQYEEEIRKPIQINFCKSTTRHDTEVARIAREYVYSLSKLASRLDFLVLSGDTPSPGAGHGSFSQAKNCACLKPEYILENNEFFMCCQLCGERFELGKIALNYGDSKRIILSQKNPHDKKHHFSECIDKFQGIQKYDFPDSLFADIEAALVQYNLLNAAAPTKAAKFARVKKDHIKLILKNLGLYKEYKEELNAIYRILTEKPMPKINHLKNRLLDDFMIFDAQYSKLCSRSEKTAYHYMLILYQLLSSYGVQCNDGDFAFLKTTDRRIRHDTTYRMIFKNLGWNYTALY